MPKIIVQSDQTHNDQPHVTLMERVVAAHLGDDHYAGQLIERLSWAAADAEALESPSASARPSASVDHDRTPRGVVA